MSLAITVEANGMPDAELSCAALVTVEERMGQPTTFALEYAVDIADGDLPLLSDARLAPGSTLGLRVPYEGGEDVLVRGPVHGQRIRLRDGGEGSVLVVSGSDTRVIMDRETKVTLWSNVTDSDAVSTILAGYTYVPDVETSSARHTDAKHPLAQHETDLQFLERLARRNGYAFWITSPPMGPDVAHFKTLPLDASPAFTLKMNADGANLDDLEIVWDVERPTSANAQQVDLNSKTVLEATAGSPPSLPLGARMLQDIAPETRSIRLPLASDDSGDMLARAGASLIDAEFFTTANCELSLAALKRPARAYDIALIEGVGNRHKGHYLVTAVVHTIENDSHHMALTLQRNAWES